MELLLAPFLAFIMLPPLALAPAAGFLTLRHRLRVGSAGGTRMLLLASAILWLVYAIYESAVWVWSQGVVAPIRIDLLVVAPVLYAVSALALVGWWRRDQRWRRA